MCFTIVYFIALLVCLDAGSVHGIVCVCVAVSVMLMLAEDIFSFLVARTSLSATHWRSVAAAVIGILLFFFAFFHFRISFQLMAFRYRLLLKVCCQICRNVQKVLLEWRLLLPSNWLSAYIIVFPFVLLFALILVVLWTDLYFCMHISTWILMHYYNNFIIFCMLVECWHMWSHVISTSRVNNLSNVATQ